MQQVNLGIIGGGTVGSGVFEALARNGSLLGSRVGANIKVHRVAVRDLQKKRAATFPKNLLTTDWREVVCDPEVNLVAELIGGTTIAREVVLTSLKLGKPVVTANKALLSAHGEELFAAAKKIRHESLLRSQRVRRHSHHQIAARRFCRQPHHGALRHRERHVQLHFDAHEIGRRRFRRSIGRRAKIGLCRNAAGLGH